MHQLRGRRRVLHHERLHPLHPFHRVHRIEFLFCCDVDLLLLLSRGVDRGPRRAELLEEAVIRKTGDRQWRHVIPVVDRCHLRERTARANECGGSNEGDSSDATGRAHEKLLAFA